MADDTHTNSFKDLIHDRTLAFLLVAVATAAVVVTTYRLVTVCICNRRRPRRDGHNSLRLAPPATPTSADRILAAELIPAHKFRKSELGDVLCAVCLSEFEEGEEVRNLPGCAHAFHAPCIDMWLFSHWTCPICRADAAPSPEMLREAAAETMLDFGALEDNVDIIQTRRSSA